jgi:predicted regulator of Ras-like GTPase activity (Roadblock/LC7/MglB family)
MADELRVDSGALIFATLADVYISSGMIDEAISILQDGLARNPNYHLAKVMLGRAYYLKGEFDKSVATLEAIYDEIKEDESANLYLGHGYLKLGDNEKAKKFYEAALKINAENTEALQALEKLAPDFAARREAESVKPTEEKPEIAEHAEAMHEVILPDEPADATREAVISAEPPTAIHEVVLPSEPDKDVPGPSAEEEITAESFIQEIPERPLEAEAVPLESLDKPVGRLLSLDSVKSVFIATKDGLLIKNYGKVENDVETICASIAGICLDVDEAFRLLKRGGLTRCIIEKPDETICVMAVGDSLLTVITKVEAKPGLVFVYARKIIEEIEEILG